MDTQSQIPSAPLKSHLAERLRDALRAELQRGHWPSRLPAERTLAREFQVSRSTLNLALRALAQEGLLRTQPGHPWYVTAQSHPTRRKERRRPEVILLRNRRFKRDQMGLRLVTEQLPYRLHRMGYEFREADPFQHRRQPLARTLAEFDAEHRAALYILGSMPPAVHRWFETHEVPAIIIGTRRASDKLPAISQDMEATVRHGVQYLARRGHRHLGLLNLPPATAGVIKSNETFQTECSQAANAAITGTIATTQSRPDAMEMAVRKLFGDRRPPTAVLVTDLDLAISLYSTLALLGLRIPRDVSVVVCGYWPLLDALRPQPTCYRVSYETLASRITRIIHDYLTLGVLPNRFWKLLPTLREGNSVAVPRPERMTNAA